MIPDGMKRTNWYALKCLGSSYNSSYEMKQGCWNITAQRFMPSVAQYAVHSARPIDIGVT